MKAKPMQAPTAAAAQQQSNLKQLILEKKLAMLQKESSMHQESFEKFMDHYKMQQKANEVQKSLKQRIIEEQTRLNELKQKELDILKKVE